MGLFDVVGSILGTNKGDEAASAQRAATMDANATQKYIYDTQRADNAPWREAGVGALKDLGADEFKKDFTMADFNADPGYAFRMSEGQKAIERSAAARGGLNSGATMKALTRFGQDTASSEFNNAYNRFNADRDRRYNRLSSLAGLGQTAQAQVNQAGMNYGNNVSSNLVGMGNAAAAAKIGDANRNAAMVSDLIGGASKMIAACDERLKENIEPISQEDKEEFKAVLKARKFTYKDAEKYGDGEWLGVMAQDLEKSKLGSMIVGINGSGTKEIDMRKAVLLLLAMQAEG